MLKIKGRYAGFFLAVLAASLLISSSVFFAFVVRFFFSEGYREMEDASNKASSVVLSYMETSDGLEIVRQSFVQGSEWTSSEMILFDSQGAALVSSESAPLSDLHLSESVITSVGDRLAEFTTLEGFFPTARLCMLNKVSVSSNVYYYVLVSIPPGSFSYFTRNIVFLMLASFLVIFAVTAPIIYFQVKRYIGPLRDMTLTAKKFGDGDFSERVNVVEHNEIGFLASTLNEMASSLEKLEETRKSFVSNVSHELKTPMTTIGGFVDGILDGTIPPSEQRHYLQIVSEETGRLSRLVRSMLNISKYQSGEVELSRSEFDLTSLTIKTVLLFEHRLEKKKVDVRGLDSPPHIINADQDLIQQVIYNLTENAVKFVNDGGYIEYNFFVDKDTGRTSLAIRNSGSGLKRNEMNRVFDKFYKTDESRGLDTTGVGLGLSIVSSIIKLHEGEVLVRSKEGEYTEFEFTV